MCGYIVIFNLLFLNLVFCQPNIFAPNPIMFGQTLPVTNNIPAPNTVPVTNAIPVPVTNAIPVPVSNAIPASNAIPVTNAFSYVLPSIKETTKATINTVSEICTRSKCYSLVTPSIEETVKNAITTETNNEITFLNNLIGAKFSSYTGPLLAIGFESPKIIDKIQKGENLNAFGISTGAVLKYNINLYTFGTCAAYTTPFVGPFAIIPGFACSFASSILVDNTYTNLYNSIFSKKNTNQDYNNKNQKCNYNGEEL